jgi:hypothetical protein
MCWSAWKVTLDMPVVLVCLFLCAVVGLAAKLI